MILPRVRDLRLVTERRGGTLTHADHRILALWAAACAEHVLPEFESICPTDFRPREAIEAARDWQRDQLPKHIRDLVIEDQQRRNSICWFVFDD